MNPQNDLLLTQLTARLADPSTGNIIGSAFICSSPALKNKVYIITAAHCLYVDKDSFKEPRSDIAVEVYNPKTLVYVKLIHRIDHSFVFPLVDKDVAVLVFDKQTIEQITGPLQPLFIVNEAIPSSNFNVKGFPLATQGKELVAIQPTWIQQMPGVPRFQLRNDEDYSEYAMNGFSGSGIFLEITNHIYVLGLFTRYRPEENGKVIYCQYLSTVNELLEKNYYPTIPVAVIGAYGLVPSFFENHIRLTIENLGPRFNPKLNYKLPIEVLFNDISKDYDFKRRFLRAFDEWLSNDAYSTKSRKKDLRAAAKKSGELKKNIFDWINKIGWAADQKISHESIVNEIGLFSTIIESARSKLEHERYEIEKKNPPKKDDHSYRPPFENELYSLRKVQEANYTLSERLNDIAINLSNHPCLLIHGEAGCGKSHLLGDIASERQSKGLPTLLLLGQLFQTGQTVWQNIIAQLGISCSSTEFLDSLNHIGKQTGSRALILIDAINEGAGANLWSAALPGFIEEFRSYPFIGIVVTVRTTYWNQIVAKDLLEDSRITRIVHSGFKGNEYEALRLFCDYYDLQQPNFPLLNPEFSNPLFLQLVCKGVKNSGEKKFPSGFQGINSVLSYYIAAIQEQLIKKREEYHLIPDLAKSAAIEFAKACYEEEQERERSLPLSQAVQLFENKFPKHKSLLLDLIHENLFIRSAYRSYRDDSEYEIVYFSFERLGDTIIAEQLIQSYDSSEAVQTAFKKENELGKIALEGRWRNRGILEALAILIPEKFNLELIDALSWMFEKRTDEDDFSRNVHSDIELYFLNSLKWRRIDSISWERIQEWLNSDKRSLDDDHVLLLFTELTAAQNHPLNSDRLSRMLRKHTMPKRDSFFQRHMHYYHGKNDDGDAYPIRRLIDWAWQPGISMGSDQETCRLVGQTLSWLLSSSDRVLRDQVTKALVNLLEEQPDALMAILNLFVKIDDLYISERLYAVAYGCILRTSQKKSIKKIGQKVFDLVFKRQNLPCHILLRDYARNTIEYALHTGAKLKGEMTLIKPPYSSSMPSKLPSEAEVEKYELDYDLPDFKKNYGHENNQIHHSVLHWDFGRYTIDSALGNFHTVSFTEPLLHKEFLKKLSAKTKTLIKIFKTTFELSQMSEAQVNRLKNRYGEKYVSDLIEMITKDFQETENLLTKILTEEQLVFLKNRLLPYWDSMTRVKDRQHNHFATTQIKCWIVQRVFELGYNAQLHGYYDSLTGSWARDKNKVERIGKKYQWIAFYEILARVADNYKLKRDRWSGINREQYYNGPWELLIRDIDPVFITRNKSANDDDDDNDLGISPHKNHWWSESSYNAWNYPAKEWMNILKDIPDPKETILKADENGQEWLYLKLSTKWEEPKPIGQKKYSTTRKEIWYYLDGYVVQKKEKSNVIASIINQKPWGDRLPRSNTDLSLFSHENYWSPISTQHYNGQKEWKQLDGSKYKVLISTVEAVGELGDDQSGAHFKYEMPCKRIFDGMNLSYGSINGDFTDASGATIVTNVNPRGMLVRKAEFERFLASNNLDIIWVAWGEKQSIGDFHSNDNRFKKIWGVFSFSENKMMGEFSFVKNDRDE